MVTKFICCIHGITWRKRNTSLKIVNLIENEVSTLKQLYGDINFKDKNL